MVANTTRLEEGTRRKRCFDLLVATHTLIEYKLLSWLLALGTIGKALLK
nr:MAG TPA: hypothetical protein [Caudoviricetes sp.]